MARIFVYDPNLKPIDELKGRCNRVWALNTASEPMGTATVYMSNSDAKLTEKLLRFRNIVVIHDGIMPDWGGQIGDPQSEGQAEVKIGATSIECVLLDRYPGGRFDGTPGQIFTQMINEANSPAPTGIVLGDVESDGRIFRWNNGSRSSLQLVQLIQQKSGYDWGIDTSLDSNYRPTFTAWFRQATGTDYSGGQLFLDEYENIEFDPTGDIITRTGRVSNSVTIRASGGTETNTIVRHAIDQASIDKYGLAQYMNTEATSEAAGVQDRADTERTNRHKPMQRFAITVNDTAFFPNLQLGNTFPLVLHTVGRDQNGVGGTYYVRIIAMAHDDQDNKVALTVQEIV